MAHLEMPVGLSFEMPPRSYDSTKRRAAAGATRGRILEAARAIIGGKGDLRDFSMESLAKRAGVSRMTLYYQFRSRARLLEALADHLAERGGMARMREVFRAPSTEEALRRLARTFTQFWASDRVVMRRLRAMAIVFPADASGPRDRDAWRREAITSLLAREGDRGGARRGGPARDLVDVLTALTGFEAFDALYTESRGVEGTAEIVGDLLVDAWHAATLPASPVRRRTSGRRSHSEEPSGRRLERSAGQGSPSDECTDGTGTARLTRG